LELLDHVVIGTGNFSSLRALGFFTNEPAPTVSQTVSESWHQ